MKREEIEQLLQSRISEGFISNQEYSELRHLATKCIDDEHDMINREFEMKNFNLGERTVQELREETLRVSYGFTFYRLSHIPKLITQIEWYKKDVDKTHDEGNPYDKELIERLEVFAQDWMKVHRLFDRAKKLIPQGKPKIKKEITCPHCQKMIHV